MLSPAPQARFISANFRNSKLDRAIPILAAAPVGPKTRPRDSVTQLSSTEKFSVSQRTRSCVQLRSTLKTLKVVYRELSSELLRLKLLLSGEPHWAGRNRIFPA